jgi:hypothetical protein
MNDLGLTEEPTVEKKLSTSASGNKKNKKSKGKK